MVTLNNYFDKIYCLNLDEATDRWGNCLEQFCQYDLIVERFSAIKPETGNNHLLRGELGVTRSFNNMIKVAKEEKLNNILVFEDDFVLIDNFDVMFDFMIKQVPDNWDFLYFGGNHVSGYTHITKNVAKMNYTYCTHAIGIKDTMFDLILKTLSKEKKVSDEYFAEMMKNCNAYTFRPTIVSQRDGFSYIQNKNVTYDCIKK